MDNPFTPEEVQELRDLLAYHKAFGYPNQPLLQPLHVSLDTVVRVISCGTCFEQAR